MEQVMILITSLINLTVAVLNLVTFLLIGRKKRKEPLSKETDKSS